MSDRRVPANSLRLFLEQVFVHAGYPADQATDAADVLMWASLRGIDTHGVRNLKPYYIDRTISGELNPEARIRIEHESPNSARVDGDSGLGLFGACHAMRLAIKKCKGAGVGMVAMRNTHHLGAAGYFAHMAVEHGMLGLSMTGHFFGKGHSIGVAPVGGIKAMFSTNPLSFAAPCERHAPFVLDMASSVATVNRIEMHAHSGRPIPAGWALDATGNVTTDPAAARLLLPLGGSAELGGHKGAGLAMMVSILSGVLSAAWKPIEEALAKDESLQRVPFDQPTMGHFFAAIRIDTFQPIEWFRAAMDAWIDALHATPIASAGYKVRYPGELESATATERSKAGIPIAERWLREWHELAGRLGVDDAILR
jgi:L-2-hydroxycarboxylate dehydrogenase (NAD+)